MSLAVRLPAGLTRRRSRPRLTALFAASLLLAVAGCSGGGDDGKAQPSSPGRAAAYRKGTLRGMHFQVPPAAETKLVRCTRGAILDIIVDLRPESPTWLRHIEVELNEDNHRALFVPERFAHGYQVLTDRTETSYQVGEFYSPPNERALRYDDPRLGLEWPLPVTVISEKDKNAPLLETWEERLREEMTLSVEVAR